jgi:peptidoglycan hydrolase-like protein with peptidoglycan-binding domain
MSSSQNGYPANDPSLTQTFTVPGSAVKLRLRKGACGEVLTLIAAWVDSHVEDIDTRHGVRGYDVPDDWGYAERLIRGGFSLSNHASGTAEDLNAVQHPLGATTTWSPAEIYEINHYLTTEWTDPLTHTVVVRWGQNYSGRKDGMHFEINAPESAVKRALAAYKARHSGTAPPPPPPVSIPKFPLAAGKFYGPKGVMGPDAGLKVWQAQMLHRGWSQLGTADGVYGPLTEQVARAFQAEKHLAVDGLIGADTWAAAWLMPVTP